MQFVAKPVLEDKFWILEDNGQKVGTIRSNENGVTLQVGSENQTFKALDELKLAMEVSFTGKDQIENVKENYEVHGYPCKTKPCNSIYDLKRKLPLYRHDAGHHCGGRSCVVRDRRPELRHPQRCAQGSALLMEL